MQELKDGDDYAGLSITNATFLALPLSKSKILTALIFHPASIFSARYNARSAMIRLSISGPRRHRSTCKHARREGRCSGRIEEVSKSRDKDKREKAYRRKVGQSLYALEWTRPSFRPPITFGPSISFGSSSGSSPLSSYIVSWRIELYRIRPSNARYTTFFLDKMESLHALSVMVH